MSAAAYNRGSRAISASIARERRPRPCPGKLNGNKRLASCLVCGGADYEGNEGDRCRRDTYGKGQS